MKKILVGFIMDGQGGGVDKYLLNLLTVVGPREVQMDFLSNEVDARLQQLLKQHNVRIFPISNLKHAAAQYKQVKALLQREKYDTVYLNISTAIDFITALAARRCQVKQVILHSHTSGNDCENPWKRRVFNGIHAICKLILWHCGTQYCACSKRAAQWMFPKRLVEGNQVQMIYNAIEETPFLYNDEARQSIREQLGMEDKIIMGHVGNFCYQKNHEFLLRIFQSVLKKEKRACLLLVGIGHKLEAMKELAKELGIEQAVHFLGYRSDIAQLMQGMDVFVIPSNFEGFPFVCVEAQYAGLPCVASNVLSPEVKITDEFLFVSLKESTDLWAETILKQANIQRTSCKVYAQADCYRLAEQKEQLRKLLL